nr:uncharacterized protein [Tanacetum cinerariifolium]
MASNKDQIEKLDTALGQLQDGIAEMKIEFFDKLQHLEDIIMKLSDVVLSRKGTLVTQKGSLASYHFQGEAIQWWQWLRKDYQEEGKEVTWDIFYEELSSRLGPTNCKEFDEALSK